jgi:RNA recognition motif-containing protein
MSARLFVGNLPFDVTEAELRDLFLTIGPLSYVFLPVDRETGKRRGFAFVEFQNEAHAGEALRRLNEQQFKGRALALSEARAKDASRPAGAPPPRPRVPRLPDSFDSSPAMGDLTPRRERRGRDDAKRSVKPGVRNARFEAPAPKGPKKEKTGGRVYGLDVDEGLDVDDVVDDVESMEEVEE